jgi:hypothetical protein
MATGHAYHHAASRRASRGTSTTAIASAPLQLVTTLRSPEPRASGRAVILHARGGMRHEPRDRSAMQDVVESHRRRAACSAPGRSRSPRSPASEPGHPRSSARTASTAPARSTATPAPRAGRGRRGRLRAGPRSPASSSSRPPRPARAPPGRRPPAASTASSAWAISTSAAASTAELVFHGRARREHGEQRLGDVQHERRDPAPPRRWDREDGARELQGRASAGELVEVAAALGELPELLGDDAGEHRAAPSRAGTASAAAAAIDEPHPAGRAKVAGYSSSSSSTRRSARRRAFASAPAFRIASTALSSAATGSTAAVAGSPRSTCDPLGSDAIISAGTGRNARDASSGAAWSGVSCVFKSRPLRQKSPSSTRSYKTVVTR